MEHATSEWKSARSNPPPEGVVVKTIIVDGGEIRNESNLKRDGGLWFLPDGSMYVYYTPTHWREMKPRSEGGER